MWNGSLPGPSTQHRITDNQQPLLVLHPDINEVLDVFARGQMVIVTDDDTRENEGDLVVAAEFASPGIINFMAREARGLICVAMTGADLDRLGLSLMVEPAGNASRFGSPFTVSVDAKHGVTTGISAFDRARTIEVLLDPESTNADLSSPGHVFPLRADDRGVAGRRGHTEAGVDLARAAGLKSAAVICEIMDADGSMARGSALEAISKRHDIPMISIEEISRLQIERPVGTTVTELESASLPTRFGEFTVTAFRDTAGLEHLSLRMGELGDAPLVRLHSECLTGDVLGSLRCDCGDQLQIAMKTIAAEGSGLIVYLRQEGRGIGLANKIKAYSLQDDGLDTVEANVCLGFSADMRDYATAAEIIKHLGVERVRLMTNNPGKVSGLESSDISVTERISAPVIKRPENARYLETKIRKLEHLIDITGS